MHGIDRIDSESRREGRGRPKLQFELTFAGQSLFPNRSAQMLGRLIGFLQEADQEVERTGYIPGGDLASTYRLNAD